MFGKIREDYRVHGRTWRHRALWALVVFRFGQWAEGRRSRIARAAFGKVYGLLSVFVPIVSGVSIDRGAKIGERFHIVHPGMVLIHPGVVIGDRVGVMHGVTLGANMGGGVPRLGNDVFIGAGALIAGPITIGDGAWVAGNSLVLSDVPPGALAMGVPAKVYPGGARGRDARHQHPVASPPSGPGAPPPAPNA